MFASSRVAGSWSSAHWAVQSLSIHASVSSAVTAKFSTPRRVSPAFLILILILILIGLCFRPNPEWNRRLGSRLRSRLGADRKWAVHYSPALPRSVRYTITTNLYFPDLGNRTRINRNSKLLWV